MCLWCGYIYTSTDSGAIWTERTSAGSRNWDSIASSADGTKIAVCVLGGYIYTSTDSGATWTAQTSAGSRDWLPIASSADGTKIAACVYPGYIYTSTDSGATWTAQTSAGPRSWSLIASSADGTKITAGVYAGYIYTGTSPTLVNLISFTAVEVPGGIFVEWETASELDNAGFHVWRSSTKDGQYERITRYLIPAEGSVAQGARYHYGDTSVELGNTYWYQLEDIDTHVTSTFHDPVCINGTQAK